MIVVPLIRVLLFTSLLIASVMLGHRETAASQLGEPLDGVIIEQNDAISTFPDGIMFRLRADAPEPIDRVELLYTPIGNETWRLALPEFTTTTRIDVSYMADLRTIYLPPGLEISYRWRLIGTTDAVFESNPQSVSWLDTRFEWQSTGTEAITVYGYGDDQAIRKEVLDAAQRTLDRLKSEFGIDHVDPLRFWIYATANDLNGALATNSEPWIGGRAFVELGEVLLVIPPGNSGDVRRTVPHEVAHHVLHQIARNPFNSLPTWLDEGLAVYYQELPDPSFPELLRTARENDQLDSIPSLVSSFPYDRDGAVLAYAESLSIVEFIVSEFGLVTLRQLITSYENGITHEEALKQSLGITAVELDQRWKVWLEDEINQTPVGSSRSLQSEGGIDTGKAVALASGGIAMAVAATLLVTSGFVTIRRTRTSFSDDDEWPLDDQGSTNTWRSTLSRHSL